MKKTLLLLFALMTSIGMAWAQTNLAAGKSVSVIYLPTGTVSPSSEELAKVTDGNTGTNVLLPNNGNDIAAISIDLDGNASTAISAIAVAQDGRHASVYTIYGTNTAPGSYSTKEDLTAAAAGWTVLASTNDDGNAGGDNTIYIKGYSANSNAGFRYIVFVPTAQAYGVSLRQIFVYDEYTPVYTLKANEDKYIYNGAQEVNFSILDQVGVPGTISAISFATATYGYATNTSKPSFTFGADFPNNVDDLNVTVGGNVVTKSFGFLTSTPAVGDVPAIDDETSYVIFSAEKNEKYAVYDGYDGPNTTAINSEFAIAGHNAVLAKKMTYVGFNHTLEVAKTDMTSLVLDIFVTEPHAKENCHVKAEGKGSLDFPQDLNRGWNHVVLTNFNTSTFAGLTSNTTLFVRIDDAADEDVVIYNLYYSKESSFIDTENPVMSSITVTSTTHNTATLTVKATDDNTSGTLTYTVKNSSEETVGTGSAVQNVDVTITITGLTPETNYAVGAFTVLATDPSSKSSTPMNVPAFTTSAAPTGLELTAGGHTILLQGKHYLDRVTNNWELIISSTDEMSSLGPCYWTLNSGNANMQDNYTKSSDNKTLTICATSTTKPVLYNNFYVNFVTGGEANFGVVNNNDLTWEESGVESLNVIVSGNTASVTGPVTAADVSTIVTNAGSSAILDLTGATLSESVTINPTNRNAIVVVNGTNRTSDKIANLGETKNVIVYDGTYRRAATGYVIALIDDNNSQPAYDFVIDAQQDGVTYTRTVAAGKWVSYNSPASVAIPAGVTVYKATDATTTSVTFTKQESQDLGANVPVILHNNTNDDVVITSNNDKIDLNLTANGGGAAINGTSIMQYGTARLIEANGDQFALQNNELKRFNTGAKIGAFRVYFTGLSSANARAIFIDGETTKIGSINANGEINIKDDAVYNLAGQRVQNPTKGIYIINGKKVVLK